MRYLSKIVFINSASVNYAEIELDGNVHFIGNQGSGKSTLLRAILFFYNANKLKLGIGREKKRYDEYYFGYQNSYIIYEVQRDVSKYCALAYKVNGKVAFRFIDSAYDKKYFISPDGKAYESWEKIRQVLGKNIHYSKIISNYEEYRQIIYGDNKGLKPEFRRYSIIESKQYQNIPRTIQNVFLNSKLEAQFIKETIINSISDDVFTIDLENYSKNHLRDFENQINDVKLWSQKNKKGQVTIRNQAEKAIENYRIYNFLQRGKKQLAEQLFKRMQFVEQEKPAVLNAFKEEEGKLNELKKKLDNLTELHRRREQDILSDIKVLKRKIEEAKNKKTKYEEQDIYTVIEKIKQEQNLEREKENLEKEKALLESKYAQIKDKYEALIKQQQILLENFVNAKNAEFNELKSKYSDEKIKISEDYNRKTGQVRKDFQKQIDVIEEQIKSLENEENRHKQKKAEFKHKVFFQPEIEECERKIPELKGKEIELKSKKKDSVSEIKNTRKEWELEVKRIERKAESSVIEKQKEIDIHQNRIKNITQKIEKSKSSFYAWLNENVRGWENTIGKVLDEEILYKEGLEPILEESSNNTLYGIKINLEILEGRVKTVLELQAEIKKEENKIQEIRKEINALESTWNQELDNLKKKFGKRINKLKDNISEYEYQLAQVGNQIKTTSLSLSELKDRSKNEKETQLNKIEENLEELAVKKQERHQELRGNKEQRQRKFTRVDNEKRKAFNQIEKNLDEKWKSFEQEKTEFEKEIKLRIGEIERQQFSEMENKGADIQRIQDLNLRLQEIDEKLAFIKEHKAIVIEYNKDKRELFDKVPEFKTQIEDLQQKRSESNRKNQKEKEKFEEKYRIQVKQLNDLKIKINEFENDVNAFEQFEKSDVFKAVEQYYTSGNKITEENQERAVAIIDDLKGKHYKLLETISEIRRTVNIFTGNFNEDNIFKFKTRFTSDSEYLEFATGLKEFIEEDKISEFEKRVNERFANIIHLIARETNELMSKEAEIEKIIRKINNDFLNKNFVEAIKEMEIRTRQSSNPVVTILTMIKEFNDENSFLIGKHNLFTSQDSGNKNQKAVKLLKQLTKELERHKNPGLKLSDSFDLQFRIVENDNDTGWVENLSNVGSEGTDILVKAMVNILLLNVFKESASRKFNEFKLHCMMDEIGRLHPVNVKGILRFANERNILLINGSPTSQNAMDYRYTYKLSKEKSPANNKYITRVKRLVKIQSKIMA